MKKNEIKETPKGTGKEKETLKGTGKEKETAKGRGKAKETDKDINFKNIDLWIDIDLPHTFITKKKALDILKEEIDYNGEVPSKIVCVKYKKKDIIIYVDVVECLCVQLGTDPKFPRVLDLVEDIEN